MDSWLTYLHLGGEPPPCHSHGRSNKSSSSPYPPAFKELPLVGQLSLPQVHHVYPFLPLLPFKDHRPPLCIHGAQDQTSHSDDRNGDDEDDGDEEEEEEDASDLHHGVVELPLLSGQEQQQQLHLHLHRHHHHHHHHHHRHHHAHLLLDRCIWHALPHELLERILAFLHVPDIVRLRSVSKLWNSLASSPNFLATFKETYAARSSAFMFQCTAAPKQKLQTTPWLAHYDLVENRWYSIALSFIPAHPTVPTISYTVVSASGGLLCLWPEPRKTWKSVGFIVCNPITQNWRELPCRSQDNRMPDLVSMYVDEARTFYKVLVVTESSSGGAQTVVTTEVYDSRSSKWTLTSTEPSSRGKFKSNAVIGAKVYLVYTETHQWFKIKVYDMEQQEWMECIPMPMLFHEMAEDFGTPEVVSCGTRLLLVGRVGKHSHKEEVVIWELLDSSVAGFADSWREVDRMPQDIAREFLGCLVFGHYYCISRGDQIFFIASFKAPMLIYDMLTRAWTWWAWPFYEKYASRFPIFGFVKQPLTFPPFGFAFSFHFDRLV